MKARADRLGLLAPVLACALCLCAPRGALAHPYHVAFAEAEANPETRRLEVALRVFPEDLERGLERMSQRTRVDLERTEDVDGLITTYLSRALLLRDPAAPDEAGDRSVVHWVGKEVGARHAWLYFEVEIGRPDGEGLEISLRAMFEVEPTQENTIRFRRGAERATVKCTRAAPWALIDFTPAPEAPDEPEGSR